MNSISRRPAQHHVHISQLRMCGTDANDDDDAAHRKHIGAPLEENEKVEGHKSELGCRKMWFR